MFLITVSEDKVAFVNDVNDKVSELFQTTVEGALPFVRLLVFFGRAVISCSSNRYACALVSMIFRNIPRYHWFSFFLVVHYACLHFLPELVFLLVFTVYDGPDWLPANNLRAMFVESNARLPLHRLAFDIFKFFIRVIERHAISTKVNCRKLAHLAQQVTIGIFSDAGQANVVTAGFIEAFEGGLAMIRTWTWRSIINLVLLCCPRWCFFVLFSRAFVFSYEFLEKFFHFNKNIQISINK